ncbi:hypothetical protein A2291_05795 [candidate division WOR-1 bacterium RIFOXYB2_FULL_42_35]|uniref:Uncharacterized protein n=1 Tax=candidate division WOR-1 bacterium RIFOXYC2_FULL_41_25 TaxID=1802586 RepID=A0A1F4TKK6_UNCSA|nr:MAG: hypothetical protein A2247_02435 [candidate division WOR-1 bacterium RIFOXYA2_FULL_41_14]OGC22431.1 MAG: hypothetical protein A2291_05795 [candidate division WOR-1 bacterium RIFOXYB2_FULL_42_35]OGC33109.1 MAG: hypothetical protein A2462_08705 [candidate division WOR-1 bacterium RIFOXYC2_FULL_41_25]OGC43427.1 MAG: hypothetical protein A2548_02695 [candidate division WOR-1 bacterium RIFOXYD2_FULL_41_8]
MINAVDLTLGVLMVLYLIKNIGGPIRTIINIVVIFLFLFFFGIMTEVILLFPVSQSVRDGYRDSYIAKVSVVLIKWIYPLVENNAPNIDKFMKERVISKPPSQTEEEIMKQLPDKNLPEVKLHDLMIKLKSTELPKLGEK